MIRRLYAIACPILFLASCASTEHRTKFSDKNMRIMIDPASIDVQNHVRVQQALVASGKWAVVDRAAGFRAIQTEQNLLHRTATERFEDKEKWAQWGKLYGVGAVVVAHIQCAVVRSWSQQLKRECQQFINLVDANTGEIIVAVEDEQDAPMELAPSWEEIADKLGRAYPEAFEAYQRTLRLVQYSEESKEGAVRQKEEAAAGTLQRTDSPIY